jgi:hypothetical protein
MFPNLRSSGTNDIVSPFTRLNRKRRRTLDVLNRHPMRTDGLPKNGVSWALYRTRLEKYHNRVRGA